jgi:hypothetical protein
LVLDELGIDHGRQRADIAVINGRMTGYEIKSDRDTLAPLSNRAKGISEPKGQSDCVGPAAVAGRGPRHTSGSWRSRQTVEKGEGQPPPVPRPAHGNG